MLYAASTMQPQSHHPILGLHHRSQPSAIHNQNKRRQLIPSHPQQFTQASDIHRTSPPSSTSLSPSTALPGVSALLQPRSVSAAGPRKRSLSGPTSADMRMERHHPHVISPTDRWDRADIQGPPTSPRSVYMNLVDPSHHAGATSTTITPRGHPLQAHPQPLRTRDQHTLGPRPYGSFPSLSARTPVFHRSASAGSAAFQFVDPAVNRLMTRHPLPGAFGTAPSASAGPSAGPNAGGTSPTSKPSRYLREMDRRVILARIDRGEKQSALAKEFQVSRAAICNLYKHRDEVLSRKDGNPLAKHPKKPRPKVAAARPKGSSVKSEPIKSASAASGTAGRASTVHELRSRAAALLLTTLRKKHTDAGAFRRSGERLVRLVLEEALALVPIKAVDIVLGSGNKADGVALEHPPCAVAMAATSRHPMLDVFADMEPEQPVGRVRFTSGEDADETAELKGDALPPTLGFHNVFLLELVAASPARACAAVRRLLERGAVESMISLVALVVTQPVVDALRAAFPAARIVTAQVEDAGGNELDAADDCAGAAESFRQRLAQDCA